MKTSVEYRRIAEGLDISNERHEMASLRGEYLRLLDLIGPLQEIERREAELSQEKRIAHLRLETELYENWLPLKTASATLGIPMPELRKRVRDGLIVGVKHGRSLYVLRDSVR